jgi:adenosylhomocysteine nucleosidase
LKKYKICLYVFCAFILWPGAYQAGNDSGPVTAILGAFDAEVELIKAAMTDRQDTKYFDITFTTGTLEGRRVVVAKAGIGKVNAAMTTTLLVEHFQPEEVVFTGIAGGINEDLHPGDIVIGSKTAQHDYCLLTDAGPEDKGTINPMTGERNPILFPADARLLDLAKKAGTRVDLKDVPAAGGDRKPQITEGVIVTGDAFIASENKRVELRDRFSADAVEMEGAAVAQVCFYLDIPCLVVRSISDRADATARVDIEKFYQIAADNSAAFVMVVVDLLSGNHK